MGGEKQQENLGYESFLPQGLRVIDPSQHRPAPQMQLLKNVELSEQNYTPVNGQKPPPGKNSTPVDPGSALGSYLGTEAFSSTTGVAEGAGSVFESASAAEAAGYTPIQTTATGQVYATPAQPGGMFLPAAAVLAANAVGNRIAGQKGGAIDAGYNALNALNPIQQGFQVGEDLGNIQHGQRISTPTQIATAIPTAGLSLLYNDFVASGKDPRQQARDKVREYLQTVGFTNDKHEVTLADGSMYNIGLDGGHREGNGKRRFEVDENNPLAAQAVSYANPLAYILTGGNKEESTAYAGYLANAALSNAQTAEGVKNNVLAMLQKLGWKYSETVNRLTQMKDKGQISQDEYNTFSAQLSQLRAQ